MKTITIGVTDIESGHVDVSENDIKEYNEENDTQLDIDNLSSDDIRELALFMSYRGEIHWNDRELKEAILI